MRAQTFRAIGWLRPLPSWSVSRIARHGVREKSPTIPRGLTTASAGCRRSGSIAVLTILAATAATGTFLSSFNLAHAEAPPPTTAPEEKSFRLKEIQQHGRNAERRWVIRGQRVYDIEEWIPSHPGGEVILRAVGGAIDPYWDIFTIHRKQDVYDVLEQYFIGLVDPRDLVDGKLPNDYIEDPFETDPARDPSLIVHSQKPFNAETPTKDLAGFITPIETHYVRHHLWVPELDAEKFRLTIEMANGEEKAYSIDQLWSQFEQHTITATLQCSGNRRKDMTVNARPAAGLQWGPGAISNATWTGVKLRDVLKDTGLAVDKMPEDVRHVQFLGAEAYGSSIPIEKVLDIFGDVMLVFEMNGKTLTPDHGYPLRVLVPGFVAARSVKWISKIMLSEDESTSQWQQRDYKCFGPNVQSRDVDWTAAPAIQEMPVQSVITNTRELSRHNTNHRSLLQVYGLEEDSVLLEGYAFAGGGRRIARVDISVNGGQSWQQAELLNQNLQQGSKSWSWTNWRFAAPKGVVSVGQSCIVKAVDEANNCQPEQFEPTYNFRGNLTNAWHRVTFKDESTKDAA